MRISDFIKAIGRKPKEQAGKDYSIPKGWYTIEQIRQELNIAHTRNASSRAFELHKRGLLERIAHTTKANTGQCHQCYIYRPTKPYKTIAEANSHNFKAREDKVPKGWVRIIDHSYDANISHVAIRARVARANLKPRFFKTARGISGLHMNAYYRKTDLDRIVR